MKQQERFFDTHIAKAAHLPYSLYVPEGYGDDPKQKWPLILFLHGAGERAQDDMLLLRKYGIPHVVEERDLPFITISPQCPPDMTWGPFIDVLIALLDDTMAHYAVDRSRVYLTGLSMGGYGSWHLGIEHPERFAAIVPICGGGDWTESFREKLKTLADKPIWVFHGAKDPWVPLEESERIVRVLREYGSSVRFTIYPEAAHDAWTETYNNPELYTWLLAQRL